MKVSILVSSLFIVSSFSTTASAFDSFKQTKAQNQSQSQYQSNYSNNLNTNTSVSRADAFSRSNSNANAIVRNAVVTNVTNTDSGQMHYSGGYELENVPDVSSPNVYPTSPCMGSSSMGGAGVGFGISFGTSWKDDDCGVRETARSFAGMGMKEDALAVLCSSEYAKSAPSCKKYIKVEE